MSACGSTSGSPTSPNAPKPDISISMTLAPGQRANVEGTNLTLQFTGVASDGRCPGDALCVTAGEAVAVFEATLSARGGARLELSTRDTRGVGIGDYTLELRGLDPYPFASLPPIQPSDYRATVHIVAR